MCTVALRRLYSRRCATAPGEHLVLPPTTSVLVRSKQASKNTHGEIVHQALQGSEGSTGVSHVCVALRHRFCLVRCPSWAARDRRCPQRHARRRIESMAENFSGTSTAGVMPLGGMDGWEGWRDTLNLLALPYSTSSSSLLSMLSEPTLPGAHSNAAACLVRPVIARPPRIHRCSPPPPYLCHAVRPRGPAGPLRSRATTAEQEHVQPPASQSVPACLESATKRADTVSNDGQPRLGKDTRQGLGITNSKKSRMASRPANQGRSDGCCAPPWLAFVQCCVSVPDSDGGRYLHVPALHVAGLMAVLPYVLPSFH